MGGEYQMGLKKIWIKRVIWIQLDQDRITTLKEENNLLF
jgi:hypothetical protein